MLLGNWAYLQIFGPILWQMTSMITILGLLFKGFSVVETMLCCSEQTQFCWAIFGDPSSFPPFFPIYGFVRQCGSQKKFVCPFVGLHCGCVPPFENMCVRSLGYIVGASPPLWKYVCPFVGLHCGCVPPSCVPFHWKTIFVGSLHAAYSALRHFFYKNQIIWLSLKCS